MYLKKLCVELVFEHPPLCFDFKIVVVITIKIQNIVSSVNI